MSTYTRINTPRKQGGLGAMKIPLLSDLTHQIAKDYGVYLEDQGHTLRCIYCHWQYSCYVTLRLLRSELMMVGGTVVLLSSACLTENVYESHLMDQPVDRQLCVNLSQGTFHHRWQRHPEADHHERSSSGQICGRDSAAGAGLPVHWQTRRRCERGFLCCLILSFLMYKLTYMEGLSSFSYQYVYMLKKNKTLSSSNSEIHRNWWMLLCIFCSVPSRMEARQWHSEYPWNQTLIQTLD